MNNIDTIINNLIEKNPHLTPTDIADIIWLAIKLLPDKDSYPQNNNKVEPSGTLPSHNLESVNQVSPTLITEVQNTKITPSDLKPNLIIPSPRVETEMETPVASLHSTNTQSKEDYQPNLSQDRQSSYVNIAKSRVLPYLATSRALRPLIKKIPSKTQFLIDEQATAQKMADDLIFIKELPLDLVLKPATKPAYQLTLIVDQSESMIIWKEIIDEFENLLKHLGAFSNVQSWQLISDGENVQISKKNSSIKEVPRNYKELVSTKDNHLIFIISDCVASNWHNGKIAEALNFLGKTSTIVIFQVFPKTLWTHTALDEALMVKLDTIANSPNSNINSQPLYYVEEKMLGDYYKSPIPVLIFDPISISYWAKSLVGIPNNWVSGARFLLNIKNLQNPHDNSFVNTSPNQLETVQEDLFEADPDEIVENFYQNASPTARKLAVILSLLTFDFNLISIIKREFLPELQQFHIAEIFLSGLIKKVRKLSKDKENFYYDFIEGTQELLVSGTSNPDQDYSALVKEISAYVKETIDNPSSFSAILQPLVENKDKILSALSKPFAYLDSKTLKSLSDTCNLYNETNSSSRNIKSNYTISFDKSTGNLPKGVNSKYVIILSKNNILLPITNFVWAKTNSLLAIVGVGGYINVVNTINKKEEWFKILESEISAINWSPDDKQLALGTVKGSIYLLDAKTGEELKTLSEHQGKIYNVEWVTRDKTNYDLVSCSADQTIRKWDAQAYEHKHTGKWPITNLEAIAWTPNWDSLATISDDNKLKIWYLSGNSWHDSYNFTLYERATAFCWAVDGKHLAIGLLNGDIALTPWPNQENHNKLIFFREHKERITSLAISTDDKILASKSLDDTLKLWSVDNQEVLLEIFSQTIKQSLFSALAFNPQESILTTLNDSDGTLYLWKLELEQVIENQKLTKFSEYSNFYTKVAQGIRLKDMDTFEQLSLKMSQLKEREQKIGNLLNPTEFAEWKKENNRFIPLLHKDYLDWNNWKSVNKNEIIDLSYQDLSKYKLNLTHFNFEGVNFQGANLADLDLTDTTLNNANLSEAILINTRLNSAKLINTNLTKAQLAANNILYGDFSSADFSEANLSGITLENITLDNVNFTNANLSNAKLIKTALSETNFTGSHWSNTKLSDVDLSNCIGLDEIKHENRSTLIFSKPQDISFLPATFLSHCQVINKTSVVFINIDAKIDFLSGLVNLSNQAQDYYDFQIYSISIPGKSYIKTNFGGQETLPQTFLPLLEKQLSDLPTTLGVDFVCCLTANMIAFEENGNLHFNFFCADINKDCFAISTYKLREHAKRANTNLPKAILFILSGMLLAMESKWAIDYHDEIAGCLFDKCIEHSSIVEGLRKMKFEHPECRKKLQNLFQLDAIDKLLVLDLSSLINKKHDDEQHIKQLIKKASELHETAKFEEAIKLYDEAITLSESYLSTKDIFFIKVLADATMNKGLVLSDLGDPEEALLLINKAIKYYEQDSQLSNQRINAIIIKASILTELTRHHESILSCDEGITIIKSTIKTHSLEEIELLASLLNNKGQSLHKLNRLSEELNCYNEGISLCENFNEDISSKLYEALASLLLNKAVIFNRMDNNIEAEQLQDKAIFYYKELVNKEGEKHQPALAQALIGKAISLHNQNKFNEAINCCDSASNLLTTLIEKGHFQLKPNLAMVLHNKASVLKNMNDFSGASIEYDKAIEIRQQLIESQQRIDISADLASSFLAKADLLKELNQLSEAHNLYNKAEDIYSDLVENKHLSQFIPDLASVYNHKGDLLRELRETKQALSYYDKAISYYETLLQEKENSYLSKDLAKCFSDKAFTLWDIMDKEQAVLYFDKAIEIYRNLIKLPGPTRTLQKDLANTLVNKSNIQQSIVYCDEAIEYYKILLEENKEIKLIQDFIIAYNIKSKIAAGSGKFQKAIEYSDEIIKFAKNLEQDIYKNIYPQMAMILSNKASYLEATNSLSEALNTSDEAINLYNSLLKDIPNLKTKGHLTLVYNLVTLLYRKAEILHELNRFEDSLNTYNKIPYWQKLYIQFCMQSGLNQLISFFLETLFIHLYRRTIIRIELNYLDDLIIDIKDTFDMVKPSLLPGSIEELNWQHYAKQLNQLPRVSREQIYSKIRSSSKELSLALGIIDPTPTPTIVGTIKEDSTVYYTQKDVSREFWGDNKNSRRLTNLIYEIVNEESYGIVSLRKALRNVQETFPDFWANEKLFFHPLTDNRPVFPAKILVHTNLPITNSSNQDISLSLNAQKQKIYLLDIPEDKERKLYCEISISPQFEQTQHLRVAANNTILVPLEITLEINIFPSIANFQSCENAYTFLYSGQHFLDFLRKPINKLNFYFDVNDTSKIETYFTLDISKELEKLDFSRIDVEDVISNYKYIDNLVSQLDKIRIQQDLTKTNLVNATILETKEILEKELKEWQQEELIWLIKQGKDTWNNWRYRHPEQNIDLSNRQLKLDLEKSKTWLTSFDLSYANLQKCDLSSLELGQANLQGANLSNSILSYANIALTNFNKATLKNVEIENTVVIGVNFTETDFTGSNLTAINLRESKLDKANFSNCKLTKTQIVNSTLSETNFAGSYWNDTKLIDSDLTKATGLDKIIHQGTSTLIFTNPIEISNLPTQILQNCKIEFSSKTPKHWLLRTKPHITEINKVYEGREWQYEIVPYEAISQGDIVHFWRNSEQDIYGWGEVIKNPGLPNNFSLQQNQSVKLDVKIKAMSSDSIDKNTIRHYVPEIVELVKNASVGLGVIALSSLQVERLNNLYPLHRMAPPLNSLTVVSRSSASIPSNQQQISTFEYKTVKVDKKGKIIERTKKEANQIIDDLGNGVVLEMVEIPTGSFMMGSPHGEGYDWEKPQHKVEVPAFYMGKYQVTQEQWQSIMGSNPSYFKEDKKLPVEQVSWNDAVEFCKRLSEKTNKIYRLPSEAEWEYACRGRTETPFAFGETINTDIVNYDGNYPYGEGLKGEYRAKTTVVGSLGVANEFGLYDMHGNVWEWCQDEWHDSYKGAPIDGSAWKKQNSNNTNWVLRGGSYIADAYLCRSASSYNFTLDFRVNYLGFRLVMAARTLK